MWETKGRLKVCVCFWTCKNRTTSKIKQLGVDHGILKTVLADEAVFSSHETRCRAHSASSLQWPFCHWGHHKGLGKSWKQILFLRDTICRLTCLFHLSFSCVRHAMSYKSKCKEACNGNYYNDVPFHPYFLILNKLKYQNIWSNSTHNMTPLVHFSWNVCLKIHEHI